MSDDPDAGTKNRIDKQEREHCEDAVRKIEFEYEYEGHPVYACPSRSVFDLLIQERKQLREDLWKRFDNLIAEMDKWTQDP